MPEIAALSRPAPATLSQLLATVDQQYAPDGKAQIELAERLLERLPAETDASRLRQRGLDAAMLLSGMRLDPEALAATVLAPSLERLRTHLPDWSQQVSPEVAQLVTRVGELKRVRWDRLETEAVERLRRMFLAMAKDVRVVLIVLALRVLLMRELEPEFEPSSMAQRLARETLRVYAPLANRLGVWQLKWELEDWSLRALEPRVFEEICRLLAERREQRQAFIDEVTQVLSEELRKTDIEAKVKGRPKHIYSIYNKMRRKQISFEQVYDISAVRVLTQRVADCYAALGVVHSLWAPIPNEFDDYVAMPKGNGYQSLHTAVIGPRGRPVEVQIRTHEMHRYAEFGVAAHWAYKERRGLKSANDKFLLLRQLIDWERELKDPQQFVESLKTDLFEDQVFVFTPDGDIVDLPKGATPVDFAYRIHTEVGHRCRGARVNDQIVPLDYQLRTGDRVEILTQKQPQPNRDWMSPTLGYLHTSRARAKVKHWFRQQGREQAIAAGKELVQKELARLDLRPSTEQLAKELKYSSVDDLYAAVGYGDRRPQAISSAALQLEGERDINQTPLPKPALAKKPVAPSGVSIEGADRILGQRARCCTPLPGDDVVGFISRGRGLVIHRRDCDEIQHSSEPERVVDVDWGTLNNERHRVEVELLTQQRSGLLGDLLKLVSHLGAHIAEAQAVSQRNRHSTLRLGLELKDSAHVSAVLERLDRHPEVIEVRRLKR